MRTIHRIGIGLLVGLVFASGYATRIQCINRQQALARSSRNQATRLSQGTRVASTQLADVADVDIRPLETLYTVLNRLKEHYVEQLTVEDEGKMTYDAVRTMLASFADPNTRFIEPAQRTVLADAEQGKFHGIGAILAIKQTWKPNKQKPSQPISEEHLIVATLLPNSPAAKAGLKPGDEIVAING
jgi:C-terminal processing protease CtpA/Prc